MLQYKLSRFWRRYGQEISVITGLLFGLTAFGIAGRAEAEIITWGQAGFQIAICAAGILTGYAGYKKVECLEGDYPGNYRGSHSKDIYASADNDAARIRRRDI